MRGAGIGRDHAVRRLAQREQRPETVAIHNHRVEVRDGLDLLEHGDFLGRTANDNQGVLAMSVDSVDELSPTLEGPELVVVVQTAPALSAWSHAAMVTRLDDDALPPHRTLAFEPRAMLCPI